jgi:hypothetical protein
MVYVVLSPDGMLYCIISHKKMKNKTLRVTTTVPNRGVNTVVQFCLFKEKIDRIYKIDRIKN